MCIKYVKAYRVREVATELIGSDSVSKYEEIKIKK